MATIRQTIVADAISRLQTVATGEDSEFETNAGSNVFVGERPELGKDDPDEAIAVVLLDDEVTQQQQKTYLTLPVEIQAVVKVAQRNAWLQIEAMLGDIKRAMETDPVNGRRELGRYPMRRGSTRTLPREPGSTTAGVGVTYFVDMSEGWGTP